MQKIYNKVNNRCLFVHRADICISNYKNLSIFLYWVVHIWPLPVLGGSLNLEFSSNNNNNNNNNHTMSLVNSSFKICGIQLNTQNKKKTNMSVILKSYNALYSHHFNGISSNVPRNPNVTMYSLELYCSLLVFSLRVQPKVHIRES